MPQYLVTALFSLFGGVVAAVVTYLLTRHKTGAEVAKLRAETKKLELEGQKLSNEMDKPIGKKLGNTVIGPSAPTLEIITKGTRQELEKFSGKLTETSPIILTLAFGKGDQYYDGDALRQYVAYLSAYPLFKGAVVVDNAAKFLAYFPKRSLIRFLEHGNNAYDSVESVNKSEETLIPLYQGAVTITFDPHTTTLEALRTMIERDLESAIALDSHGRVVGLTEREQLLGRAVLALAG